MRLIPHFKTKLLTGLFVLIPLLVTLYVVYVIVSFLDGILYPALTNISLRVLGSSLYIPGLGLLLFVIITYATGVITSNYAGKKLLSYGEALLKRIPFVKSIYGSTKDFMEAFSSEKLKSFREVVLLEFPHKGLYTVKQPTARSSRPPRPTPRPGICSSSLRQTLFFFRSPLRTP
jgi:uncharacterized membrane protein